MVAVVTGADLAAGGPMGKTSRRREGRPAAAMVPTIPLPPSPKRKEDMTTEERTAEARCEPLFTFTFTP